MPTPDLSLFRAQLEHILQCALEVHQAMEAKQNNPVRDLALALFGTAALPVSVLAEVVFPAALFSPPQTQTLERFHNRLSRTLKDPAATLLWRRLREEPPRAWSYRSVPHMRALAYPLAGPDHFKEEFFDALLFLHADFQPEHSLCLAWPISWHDLHLLVAPCSLTRTHMLALSELRPFPLHQDERCFWNELRFTILRTVAAPKLPTKVNAPQRPSPRVAPAPHEELEALQRLLLDFASDTVVIPPQGQQRSRQVRIRPTIARGPADPAFADLLQVLQRATATIARPNKGDDATNQRFLARLLAAYGTDADGAMPEANPNILRNQPCALLCLPDDHPLFAGIHPRESVRAALAWAEGHPAGAEVRQAFQTFLIEQRWSATFSSIDPSLPAHLEVCSLKAIARGFQEIFAPQCLHTPLRLALGSEQLIEDLAQVLKCEDPTVQSLCEATLDYGKALFDSDRHDAKVALLQVARRWRSAASGVIIENSAPRRGASKPNTPDVNDSIASLAALFETRAVDK